MDLSGVLLVGILSLTRLSDCFRLIKPGALVENRVFFWEILNALLVFPFF